MAIQKTTLLTVQIGKTSVFIVTTTSTAGACLGIIYQDDIAHDKEARLIFISISQCRMRPDVQHPRFRQDREHLIHKLPILFLFSGSIQQSTGRILEKA